MSRQAAVNHLIIAEQRRPLAATCRPADPFIPAKTAVFEAGRGNNSYTSAPVAEGKTLEAWEMVLHIFRRPCAILQRQNPFAVSSPFAGARFQQGSRQPVCPERSTLPENAGVIPRNPIR